VGFVNRHDRVVFIILRHFNFFLCYVLIIRKYHAKRRIDRLLWGVTLPGITSVNGTKPALSPVGILKLTAFGKADPF
jgi:hypothetical protein